MPQEIACLLFARIRSPSIDVVPCSYSLQSPEIYIVVRFVTFCAFFANFSKNRKSVYTPIFYD